MSRPASTAASSNMSSANVPTVGGAPMYPNKTIVENAMNSKDHTTLVAAVKAAGLVDTLSGPGPFTVFAPTNNAFGRLPPGTVDTLMQPANKAALTKVLTYHVVPGTKTAEQIMADIRAGSGTATYTSVQGGQIRAQMEGQNLILTDANGNKSYVTQADVMQSNGVIHVVNGVLLPAN
nr:fasciclin domain-containing protein [Allosphingosinicella indica]